LLSQRASETAVPHGAGSMAAHTSGEAAAALKQAAAVRARLGCSWCGAASISLARKATNNGVEFTTLILRQ
jgi:hypothetical protein